MILFINANDTSRHTSSANTAIYPNLGLLTLMSALKEEVSDTTRICYIDGTVYSNAVIEKYIEDNADDLSVICFSALTSNFGISAQMAQKAKVWNPKMITIFGNDHFSALYKTILKNHSYIDYGFYGNDVVTGFSSFVGDVLRTSLKSFKSYPGLVYRDRNDIVKNPEDPNEYSQLPLVNYQLLDVPFPHQKKYLEGQQETYFFMRERQIKSQVIDIGRGCVKFSGKRIGDIPLNACDFCGIIPGSKAVIMPSYQRAWAIIKNAYDQGYNYLYITADELPLTMWNLLKRMVDHPPDWYMNISFQERPKLFGYARAEGFVTEENKNDLLINGLGFDHFFVGFDGLSDISLRVMNKQPIKKYSYDLMEYNQRALQKLGESGCLITAGIVVTHLGITEDILNQNFEKLVEFVESYPTAFAALDFGPLCPIPGSQSFMYFTNPWNLQKKEPMNLA